jgi:sugar phosphate isomerase/epimerase
MIDLFGYLESCKYRYGLDTADIWNGMLTSTEPDYIAKVAAALKERELTLVNLCVDGPHLWEDDPDVRKQHFDQALEYMRVAEQLGARTLRIDAGGQGDAFSDEQMDYIAATYRRLAGRAADEGYRMGPENHWGPEVAPANMVRICKAVDHPAFGVLLHFRGNEGDAQIAPYAMHTHISWEITENSLAESLGTLRAAGYRGCWGVEHHSGENEYGEVAIQVAKVRDLISRW